MSTPSAPARPARGGTNPAVAYLASLSPGSRRTMTAALETIARMLVKDSSLRTLPWASLRHEHVAAVRAGLASRFAPATANRMLAALKGTLKAAWRMGQVDAEEFHRAIDVKRVPGARAMAGRALEAREVGALLATCDADARPPTTPARRFRGLRDAALLALLYAGGLRRSEAASLAMGDYDPADGSVRVRRGKGGKERRVYLSPSARGRVDVYLAARGQRVGGLLTPRAGVYGAMSDHAVFMLLRARAGRAGIDGFSPHDLRRTFISNLLEAGADISSAQRLAGHSSVATTQRYDRRGEATIRRAADLIVMPDAAA